MSSSPNEILNKALQIANTAVLIDNARNDESAIQAYLEASSLLQQVMKRSSVEDDKQRLEALVSDFSRGATKLYCYLIDVDIYQSYSQIAKTRSTI